MKSVAKKMFVLISLFVFVAFSTQSVLGDDEIVSIVGEVDYDMQIITDDGEMYRIGDSEKGDEVKSLAGKRIEVTGGLYEIDGELFLNISSYNIVEESSE